MDDVTQTAEWQRGYPIEQLKALAAPFKARHKPLVFGAFGLTKERDVAEALASGKLLFTGAPPQAVAIASITQRPSEQADFAQRPFTVPGDSAYVKSFAALEPESGTKILNALKERAGNRAVVCEIFEEDDVARECVKRVGLDFQASKISAGSEIKGVYANTSLGIEPIWPEDITTLAVLMPEFLDAEELQQVEAELDAYGDEHFAQHYSDYNKRKSWTSFALQGYADDPHFIIKPAEMSKAWKEEHPEEMKAAARLTQAAAAFPLTLRALERLNLKFDRVRFMRLRSKDGELSRHADITDREAGTADGFISRLHIPIRTSEAVTFYGWSARGEKIETKWPAGALCYLDQRKPHSVKNTDPELDRVHLVVDCFADHGLREIIGNKASEPPGPFEDAA